MMPHPVLQEWEVDQRYNDALQHAVAVRESAGVPLWDGAVTVLRALSQTVRQRAIEYRAQRGAHTVEEQERLSSQDQPVHGAIATIDRLFACA